MLTKITAFVLALSLFCFALFGTLRDMIVIVGVFLQAKVLDSAQFVGAQWIFTILEFRPPDANLTKKRKLPYEDTAKLSASSESNG
jgi:hypothetical protein